MAPNRSRTARRGQRPGFQKLRRKLWGKLWEKLLRSWARTGPRRSCRRRRSPSLRLWRWSGLGGGLPASPPMPWVSGGSRALSHPCQHSINQAINQPINQSMTRFQHRAGCVQGGPASCPSMDLCSELGVPNCAMTSESLILLYVVRPALGRPAPTGFARESTVHQPVWQPRICLSCHMSKPSQRFEPGHLKHCVHLGSSQSLRFWLVLPP